jgi:hypothetical protein
MLQTNDRLCTWCGEPDLEPEQHSASANSHPFNTPTRQVTQIEPFARDLCSFSRLAENENENQ